MTDRPILFSAPMVKALLDGRKTQTRRIIEPTTAPVREGDILVSWPADQFVRTAERFHPRFAKGDRLWVRESFWVCEVAGHGIGVLFLVYDEEWTTGPGAREPKPAELRDWVGSERFGKRPGIHMPRWASRLTLTVTDVRVQRLQEISEADAVAEGATERPNCAGFGDRESGWCMDWSRVGQPSKWATDGKTLAERDVCLATARHAFWNLFDKINDLGTWNANPWVVAVTFTVERRNIDQ